MNLLAAIFARLDIEAGVHQAEISDSLRCPVGMARHRDTEHGPIFRSRSGHKLFEVEVRRLEREARIAHPFAAGGFEAERYLCEGGRSGSTDRLEAKRCDRVS